MSFLTLSSVIAEQRLALATIGAEPSNLEANKQYQTSANLYVLSDCMYGSSIDYKSYFL
jgi:hypothetical protein